MSSFIRSHLVGDTVKLITGVTIGRIVLFAALPLATQFYSPEQFALLAVFMAIANTVAVAACFRFDIAISVADNDEDALHLFIVALITPTSLGLLLASLVWYLPLEISALVGSPDIAQFLWLIPLSVLLISGYSALQCWAVRKRRFGAIAQTRASQAVIGAGIILGVGWLNGSAIGLLAGTVLTVGGGAGFLLWVALSQDLHQFKTCSMRQMQNVVARFKRYPLLSTPDALANIAGIQVPIVIIASFAEAEAGQLFLALQIMSAPVVFFGSSISQVYASRLPEVQANGTLARFTQQVLRNLALTGIAPICLLGLLGPFSIALVFGPEWELSGTIMSYMVPWMVFQFLSSPISFVMMSTNRQVSMLVLTLFGGALRILTVAVAAQFGTQSMLIAHFAASALFYFICLLTYAQASQTLQRRDFRLLLCAGLVCLLVYAAAAFSLGIW